MRGFAMLGPGTTGWIEKERPKCGPMDAICRPLSLAACTSDIHTVYENALGPRTDMILGHEGTGEVVEVGSLVKDFKPGDKVMVAAITPDWNSVAAQGGFAMHSGGMLAGWKFSNIKDGMFAEFFHVNDADGNLAHLPEGMDVGVAAMMSDMIPTGFHASELAKVEYGDTVCVIGIGPVGLMGVRGAVLRGASRIYAVGTRPNCIEVAKKYGATEIVSYKDGPLDKQILELTKGQGVDKVIVAGGDCDTFDEALKMLKAGGIIGNVNYIGKGDYVKIPRAEWGVGMGHKTITGGLMPGGRRRLERLASLITTNRVDPSLIITHRYDGLDKVEDMLQIMHDKPIDLIKPVAIINW
ncbi:MAG: NAD(P)-dependent alcohol dehydrogenase [Defluviitaleaceae bacterium]|nr:NAD(P)-dependent alcohol dehydrogenase [Defluviitaleaceae bacterium]